MNIAGYMLACFKITGTKLYRVASVVYGIWYMTRGSADRVSFMWQDVIFLNVCFIILISTQKLKS